MLEARERFFTSVSAGNVAFPAVEIAGQSSLSRFRYEERDGHVIVFDVPLMDEHEDDTRPKPFDRLKGRLFEEVFKSTQEYEEQGAYAAIIVGHTAGNDDEVMRQVVGHVRNFRMDGKEPDRQIVGDMWFQLEFFENAILTNLYPRRSPEISRVDLRMDPIALLGATSPARPLPDMLFAKAEGKEVYMASSVNRIKLNKEPVMDPETKSMFDKLNERMDQFAQSLAKYQQSDDDDDKKDDDDKDKEKKAKAEDEEKTDKEAEEDKDKEKKEKKQADSASKERFAQMDADIQVLKANVSTLTTENARLSTEKVAAEIDGKVQYMKRSGFSFGSEEDETKLVDSLAKLSPEDRKARYEQIEKFHKRAPVGTRIDRTAMETGHKRTGEPEDEVSHGARMHSEVVQYQKTHPGVSMDAALRVVTGVDAPQPAVSV